MFYSVLYIVLFPVLVYNHTVTVSPGAHKGKEHLTPIAQCIRTVLDQDLPYMGGVGRLYGFSQSE